jgi:hypothetical protein
MPECTVKRWLPPVARFLARDRDQNKSFSGVSSFDTTFRYAPGGEHEMVLLERPRETGKQKAPRRRSSVVECPELVVEVIEASRHELQLASEAVALLEKWMCRRNLEYQCMKKKEAA